MIAYNDEKGITGKSSEVFTGETWDGNGEDYISQDDVNDISCDDVIRCVASLDIKTKQSGWNSKDENFEIVVD